MKLLRIDHETTANVGVISGGSATNIVCDSVTVRFEARSLDNHKLKAQVDHMVDCIHKACEEYGTTSDVEIIHNYPAFSIDKDSEIAQLAVRAIEKINLKADLKSTGGGSDTNIINGNGIASVNLSVGMSNVHTTSEFIAIESLTQAAQLVASIIQEVQNT